MRVYIVLLFFVAFIAQGKADGESKGTLIIIKVILML